MAKHRRTAGRSDGRFRDVKNMDRAWETQGRRSLEAPTDRERGEGLLPGLPSPRSPSAEALPEGRD